MSNTQDRDREFEEFWEEFRSINHRVGTSFGEGIKLLCRRVFDAAYLKGERRGLIQTGQQAPEDRRRRGGLTELGGMPR